jgi:hypothetical protein
MNLDRILNIGLGSVVVGSALLLIASFACFLDRSFAIIFATMLVGFGTIWVILWQGSLIKRQIQFQTYLELEKEWNSKEMLHSREIAARSKGQAAIHELEAVLEFLEKFSLFKKRNAMDMQFILSSSIGWYAVRYFYLHKSNIVVVRQLYKDPQLYEDLEEFYNDYLVYDGHRTVSAREEFERSLDETKEPFFENESRN